MDELTLFTVVLGVLGVTLGVAFAVVAVAGAVLRRREHRAVDLLGDVRRPTRHRRFRTARGCRHV